MTKITGPLIGPKGITFYLYFIPLGPENVDLNDDVYAILFDGIH